MAVTLKLKRFSKCGSGYTELPTHSPTCSEDQKPFFRHRKFKWSCFEHTLWQGWGLCDHQAIGTGGVLGFCLQILFIIQF